MPILQKKDELERSKEHVKWLKNNFTNIDSKIIDLSDDYENLISKFNSKNMLANANTRARIRMTTLYHLAQTNNYLVVGTGNKVEDFGVGFFTKYGDGGVDISPIADLLKTEIYTIGEELGINKDILKAAPTDGLWDDGKTDEEQIGATYPELEWAMNYNGNIKKLNPRQKEVLNIYKNLNLANQHKMHAIPVCSIPKNLK
jgi:NAD+ synthase